MEQLVVRARALATVAVAAARAPGSPLAQLRRVDVQAGVITMAPLSPLQAADLLLYAKPKPLMVDGFAECTIAARFWSITDAQAPSADDWSS